MSLRETLGTARLSRIARRAAEGDARAFGQLYRALHPVVWRYVSRRISAEADVEDLVARVFTRVVEHLHRFDPERGAIKAWVLSIARNAVIDHFRVQRACSDAEAIERLADAAACPGQALEDDERDAQLRRLLSSYPPAIREMFSLRFADGLRLREIAALMDQSEDAIKQRFSRTLRHMRAKLDAEAKQKGATGYAI